MEIEVFKLFHKNSPVLLWEKLIQLIHETNHEITKGGLKALHQIKCFSIIALIAIPGNLSVEEERNGKG